MDSRRQDELALGERAGERCGKLASLKIQWPSSMQRCGDDDSADKMNGWYVRGGFAARAFAVKNLDRKSDSSSSVSINM